MRKLLTGLALASAFAFAASAGQACDFHVTASIPSEEVVAMSTVDSTTPSADVTADQTCPAGATNCAPTDK